jgi:hypothetical protein
MTSINQKNFIQLGKQGIRSIYIVTAGDKHSLLIGEQPATNVLQLYTAITPDNSSSPPCLQLISSTNKGNRRPGTHASQSLTLFTLSSHCELRKAFEWMWNCTIVRKDVRPDFKFSTIFKTLHIARLPLSTKDCMASIYMPWACNRRRNVGREDYKKWGEHSRKLVNLTLCELL